LGNFIKSSQLNIEVMQKTSFPIVLCSITPRTKRLIADSGYFELSFNKLLAEALVKSNVPITPELAAEETMKIVAHIHAAVLFKDFEMMFDPRYKIDIIKVLAEIARRNRIIIQWCGTINDNYLEYSAPECIDFYSLDINKVDIICVI
jgi:hypothetical protein